jgi:hypothetical protein
MRKTRAKAWTLLDKKGKNRKKLGEIKLELRCHGSGSKKKDTSLVTFKEGFYGIPGVPKKSAVAMAWSKNPTIGPVKVKL